MPGTDSLNNTLAIITQSSLVAASFLQINYLSKSVFEYRNYFALGGYRGYYVILDHIERVPST